MTRFLLAAALAAGLTAPATALAGTCAGVTHADSITNAEGKTLVLNGMGQRVAYGMFKVYVGGLYVTSKSSSGSTIINAEAPKRIVMQFVRDVPKDKMQETFAENFAKNPASANLKQEIGWLYSVLADVKTGDKVSLDYRPGVGTTVAMNGKDKTTIPGSDFMKAVFAIYLGSNPAYTPLRDGMLGNASCD